MSTNQLGSSLPEVVDRRLRRPGLDYYMKPRQVAKRLGLSKDYILDLIAKGKPDGIYPAVKPSSNLVLVSESAVRAWLKRNERDLSW